MEKLIHERLQKALFGTLSFFDNLLKIKVKMKFQALVYLNGKHPLTHLIFKIVKYCKVLTMNWFIRKAKFCFLSFKIYEQKFESFMLNIKQNNTSCLFIVRDLAVS